MQLIVVTVFILCNFFKLACVLYWKGVLISGKYGSSEVFQIFNFNGCS
jgi:hypothetical protein